jgi:hypothetical protein
MLDRPIWLRITQVKTLCVLYATTLLDSASDRSAQRAERVRLRGDPPLLAIFGYQFLSIANFTAELSLG